MGRLLVQLATGPENPTRVVLGLFVARSALDAGHEVDHFIAGDGVAVLRSATFNAGNGHGRDDPTETWLERRRRWAIWSN